MSRELIEAAKAVCNSYDSRYERICLWETLHERLATLRAAVSAAEAAPVADTVAVPVATLRCAVNALRALGGSGTHQTIADDLDALLPPPPAPEPSAELVEQWQREAKEYADKCCAEHESVTHDEYVGIQTGYVGRARAEWAKKGGG